MPAVPQRVKNAARKGLVMHRNRLRGGTEAGWARARQLVSRKTICDYDVKIMRAWFARHRHTSYPGYQKWVADGNPLTASNKSKYRGAVAWLLWGGDPAYTWLMKIKQ